MNNRETEIKTLVEESREEITLLQSKAVKTIEKKKEKEKFVRKVFEFLFRRETNSFLWWSAKIWGKKVSRIRCIYAAKRKI